MDGGLLIDCAKRVEEMGRDGGGDGGGGGGVSGEVWQTAGLVVDAILGNFAAVYGSSFCEPLSHIK